MCEDWDNLIILDGRRFDIFEDVNPFEHNIQKVVSKGSATPEFLVNNFRDDEYFDTVYVSANPMVAEHELLEHFYKVYPLWKTDWNNDLSVVPPEAVAEKAIKAHQDHPNKRLLIHFQQPHSPWIGPVGQNYNRMWPLLKKDEISKETMRTVQVENLRLAISEVKDVLTEIQGKNYRYFRSWPSHGRMEPVWTS